MQIYGSNFVNLPIITKYFYHGDKNGIPEKNINKVKN
jgi:hypothetical protein